MLFELIIIIAAIGLLYHHMIRLGRPVPETAEHKRAKTQVARMVELADRLYAERKWLAAERAYLSVLKRDHRNVGAYNHLGVIYSKQKNHVDAIECFKIAANYAPGAMAWQNLGLAYFESGDYHQAAAAFDKSVIAEPSAQRYLALGRSYKKLEDLPHMVTAFERAAEIEPSKRVLQILFDAYRSADLPDRATDIYKRLQELG